jgi:aminomethyltransferase
LHRTPLAEQHRALGARTAPFAGWDMPIQYTGIVDEHRAVRTAAGLFDLSHMGELWLTGPGAGDALAWALTTDPRTLAVGRAHYAMICAPDGGILDDLVVYRLGEERFLVVPNAGNRARVTAEVLARSSGHACTVDDASLRTALVAVQGPRSVELLTPHVRGIEPAALEYYGCADATVCGMPAVVARTGYTGEDGFELFVPWEAAPTVWQTLLDAGAAAGLKPIGLGARDTLRLEAGMPLYGQELTEATTPFAAGLGRVVKFDKPGDFVGRAALAAAAATTPTHLLGGLRLLERGIARTGMTVYAAAGTTGTVTSGTQSPTLGRSIAMAYLPAAAATPGTRVEIGIRDSRVAAEVVPLPFYKRNRTT